MSKIYRLRVLIWDELHSIALTLKSRRQWPHNNFTDSGGVHDLILNEIDHSEKVRNELVWSRIGSQNRHFSEVKNPDCDNVVCFSIPLHVQLKNLLSRLPCTEHKSSRRYAQWPCDPGHRTSYASIRTVATIHYETETQTVGAYGGHELYANPVSDPSDFDVASASNLTASVVPAS